MTRRTDELRSKYDLAQAFSNRAGDKSRGLAEVIRIEYF